MHETLNTNLKVTTKPKSRAKTQTGKKKKVIENSQSKPADGITRGKKQQGYQAIRKERIKWPQRVLAYQ